MRDLVDRARCFGDIARDLVYIFHDLIDTHDLQIRTIDRERDAIHERIDAPDDGLSLLDEISSIIEHGVDLFIHGVANDLDEDIQEICKGQERNRTSQAQDE